MLTWEDDVEVHALRKRGWTISAIARHVGRDRLPEVAPRVVVVEVAERVGNVRSPERRARRLHRVLHDRVFARYQDDADGIDDVIGRGEFNCVSATLVEGLMAASLGLTNSVYVDPSGLDAGNMSSAYDTSHDYSVGITQIPRYGFGCWPDVQLVVLNGTVPAAFAYNDTLLLPAGSVMPLHAETAAALRRDPPSRFWLRCGFERPFANVLVQDHRKMF
jgi:hypothetical protein